MGLTEESFKKFIDDILIIAKAELSGFEWEPNYDIIEPEHKDIIISLLAQYLVLEKEHKNLTKETVINETRNILVESIIPGLKKDPNGLYQLGDSWLIKFNDSVSIVKHLEGLSYIAYLIQYKNEHHHVLKLWHLFDQKTAQIEWSNIKITKDMIQKIGFTEEDVQKARKNISNRISTAINVIGKNSKISSLEKYLRSHIKKGIYCRFILNPGEPEWKVLIN